MSNPYLTIQSPPFDPRDYGLTVFQPDMVLTAGQLNQLFGFLLGQEQQTRTRLLGVGVACGLVPARTPDSTGLTLTAGCGVPTEGDLLSLPADTTYTRVAVFDQGLHPDYPPFQLIKGLQLWEVFEALPAGAVAKPGALVTTPLAGFDLTDKVVLLYLESAVQAADECTGVACDNKGDAYNNRLHVLLCRVADAEALIRAGHREAAAAYFRLPVLPLARVRLDAQQYPDSLHAFQGFIGRAADDLAKGLVAAQALIKDVPGIGPVDEWARLLVKKAHDASRDDYIQYAYDWLKDLHEAYEEFRQATALWLVACMPAEADFPKHLLLGELAPAPGLCRPQYRHAWLRAPAVDAAPDARERALWLFQRLGHLIEEFAGPAHGLGFAKGDFAELNKGGEFGRGKLSRGRFGAPAPPPARADDLRLTPDYARVAPFDRRSLPFYYRPRLRAFWSYDKATSCRTSHILSYHPAAADAPPQVLEPFRFQVEPFSFYRVEGLLNAPVTDVLTRLLGLRQEHNLAFDVVALRADDQQRLLTDQVREFDFEDLQVEFDDVLTQIRCEEAEIGRQDKEFLPLRVALPMVAGEFLARLTLYELQVQALIGQLPAAQCIKDKLPLLLRLNAAYRKRLADLEAALTFGPFLQANPGLEHGAGVPPGGTFVLVYRGESITKRQLGDFAHQKQRPEAAGARTRGGEGEIITIDASGRPRPGTSGNEFFTRRGGAPLVVADFYLPYRVAGRGVAVQFVLPPPPASLAIAATRFCLNDAPSPLTVAPAGGNFGADALVSRTGSQFFFNPTAVGPHTLTYTAPDGQTAALDVEVLALPVAAFNFDQGPKPLVPFGNKSTGATEVTWDFGDGSAPETITLSATVTGDTKHLFAVNPDGSGKFEVNLTASNGVCGAAAKPQVVEFKPRPVLDFKPLGAVCFNSDNKLTAKPAGGTFSSKTLDIKKNLFTANPPGPHVITYELGGVTADADVFVLPGSFAVENAKTNGRLTQAEALVLSPPAGVAYEWQIDDKPAKPAAVKVEGASTRFVFGFAPNPTGAPSVLQLTIRKADQTTCPVIAVPVLIGKP